MRVLPTPDRNAAVAAWSQKDLARAAVLAADRSFIEGSTAVRALVVDLVLCVGPGDELYDACAILGRTLAQRGGSPTLASATIDHAAEVLDARDAPWVAPARAALVEGFAAALVDSTRRDAMLAWEFPACAIPLGEAGLALAAGHPSEEDEIVAAWATRVAQAAGRKGVRRAVVAGGERARLALIDALSLVGIEVQSAQSALGKPR